MQFGKNTPVISPGTMYGSGLMALFNLAVVPTLYLGISKTIHSKRCGTVPAFVPFAKKRSPERGSNPWGRNATAIYVFLSAVT